MLYYSNVKQQTKNLTICIVTFMQNLYYSELLHIFKIISICYKILNVSKHVFKCLIVYCILVCVIYSITRYILLT